MSLEFKEKTAVTEIPKAKAIVIGGKEVGEVIPSISGDRLVWHAVIHLEDPRFLMRLIQGHGPTPKQAIIAGIRLARADRDALIEHLAAIEVELGTTSLSADDLKREGGPGY